MQRFYLKIEAESPDGEAVKCETKIKVQCTEEVAASVLANIIKQDANIKKLFTQAMLLCMEDVTMSEDISDEEYEKRLNKKDENLEF